MLLGSQLSPWGQPQQPQNSYNLQNAPRVANPHTGHACKGMTSRLYWATLAGSFFFFFPCLGVAKIAWVWLGLAGAEVGLGVARLWLGVIGLRLRRG